MMQLALKIDVDTYRGTREGVPALLRTLDKHRARATFLFSLGPDHTGRALRRAFRPGFLKKVQRTSVVEHYGIKTLLYGVLLPGPHIARRCRAEMLAVRAAGHEVGIHTYDHVRWQDGVAHASPEWTAREMRLAQESFVEVFGTPAKVHGAAGWQMNATAYELTETLGFDYASDTRGDTPFFPVVGGRVIRCPQLPTTLPTLDELIGRDDLIGGNAVAHLGNVTRKGSMRDQVYTLHAELEGMKLAPLFDALLSAWRADGWQLGATRDQFAQLDASRLPACRILAEEIPGRSGVLECQGAVV
jgi:undecaprenyl phosphate-alpha-L-ara4FN deformylase